MIAVRAKLRGLTSSVRVPFILSGTQLALPLPPYTTLMGLLSCCAGRTLLAEEVRVGFTYQHAGENVDVAETWQRLEADPATGRLKAKPETAIGQRGFHAEPDLDLFVVAEDAPRWIANPRGVTVLGRSQDLMSIGQVTQVELTPTDAGRLRGTWYPYTYARAPGRLFRLVDRYSNPGDGYVRQPKDSMIFTAIDYEPGAYVTGPGLYSVAGSTDEVIYLHQWAAGVA